MVSLTQNQNQVGDALDQGTRLIKSTEMNFTAEEKDKIEDQMKILNHRWESLRSRSLDRQAM